MKKIVVLLTMIRARGPDYGCCHRESRDVSSWCPMISIAVFYFLFSSLIMCIERGIVVFLSPPPEVSVVK